MPPVAPPPEGPAPRKRYVRLALTPLRPVPSATGQRTHRWDRPVALAWASADACVPFRAPDGPPDRALD